MKFLISPRRAFAYRPFTSRRSHSSMGVLTYTSRKSSFPIILAAISRISLLGLMKAAIVMIPVSTKSLETSAMRRIFSIRSASVKPRLLLIPLRILSPSRIRQSSPRLCNSRSKAIAIVLLPEPLSPVNQIITLCCFKSSSLSCLDNILSKIGYILFSVIIQSKWPN